MHTNKRLIMAIEPLPPGDWLPAIKKILDLNGYNSSNLKSKLLVWKSVNSCSNGIIYADGAFINRLWLGKKRWALSFINKRIYFHEDRISIDDRPEYLIVKGNKPKVPPPKKQLEELWNILNQIKIGMKKYRLSPVEVKEIDYEKSVNRLVYIGDIAREIPSSGYNSLYKDLGFDYVPIGMKIIICPIGEASMKISTSFIENIKRCMKDRNTFCSIEIMPFDSLKRNIEALKNRKDTTYKGKCILFILPSKKVSPDREILKIFDDLEMLNIPFRRAYGDDPLNFSVPNQLPSIITAAGGRPHRSPLYINGHPIWTIGIDMGHSPHKNFTKLVTTLVDPDGTLKRAWVVRQDLDESIRSDKLSGMLKMCAKELFDYEKNPCVVILRDGRFFDKDDIFSSKETLGENISILEYRKNLNPQIFKLIDNVPSNIDNINAVVVPNTNTIFISTVESYNKNTLTKIAKVTWEKSWNGLELTPPQIGGLLLQSATAPGLGLQPRLLPACIYWADGIASTSETDLRFRGQPIYKL